jgi:hypothetical protein
MLRERALKITSGKIEEIKEAEDKLTQTLKANFSKYKRPVACFVTFTTQEAAQRCLEHFGTGSWYFNLVKFGHETFKLMECPIECTAANEAANIIWENLSV